MHILAALFDVADNGFDIYDAGLAAAFIGSVYFAIRWVGRKVDERIEAIATQLDERTREIQPDANHGKSLPDVHERLKRMEQAHEERFRRIDQRLDWMADLIVNALTSGRRREPRHRVKGDTPPP